MYSYPLYTKEPAILDIESVNLGYVFACIRNIDMKSIDRTWIDGIEIEEI